MVERHDWWRCRVCRIRVFRTPTMDILHSQLAALQQRLSFVATDPIDWKCYVQVSSWAITLFESYLLYVTRVLRSESNLTGS